MTIRVGTIELTGVQAIGTDEPRLLVEQRFPGHAGSFFQDMGRRAVRLEIEGIFHGEEALSALESLRAAQAKAKPLSFAADIATGIDFTDVLIESLRVRQVAGFRDRYTYALTLRERVDEPEPPALALAAVDAGILADAASWAGGALDASAAMQDIGALPGLAAGNPGMLNHLSAGDLGGALGKARGGLSGGALVGIVGAAGGLIGASDLVKGISGNAGAIGGGQFGAIASSLAKADPKKLGSVVQGLMSAGSLGSFAEKLGKGKVDLGKTLAGIDLGPAGKLLGDLAGSADFLGKLGDLSDTIARFIKGLGGDAMVAPPDAGRPS